MPQGIQVWDDAGNLILDTSTRAGGFLGSITVASGAPYSGSITEPLLAEGTPFYFLQSSDGDYQPTVTISGTTLTWQKNATYNPYWSGSIYYGVY
jgi:hypothetical protein